jgi:hypothetical protein
MKPEAYCTLLIVREEKEREWANLGGRCLNVNHSHDTKPAVGKTLLEAPPGEGGGKCVVDTSLRFH